MRRGFVLLVVLCFAVIGFLYAAPVDVPTAAQGLEGSILQNKDFGLSVAGEADFLSERELETAESEVSAEFYTGKIILTLADRFDAYAIFGQARGMEYKEKILGSNVTFGLEDNLTWGLGLNALIYELKDYGIKFFGDGKYRAVNDIDYESLTVDGVRYNKSQLTLNKMDADWEEWQVAFGVAKKFEYFMPYCGVKYSDVKVSAKATIGSTTYDLGSTNSDNTIGLFIGCAIIPVKALSIDLQGRFVDETAFTVKATYKF